RRAFRSIANYRLANLGFWQKEACRDRHALPIAEMMHVSALERLGKTVSIGGFKRQYHPKNLMAVLQAIKDTYTPVNRRRLGPDILIVNWEGTPLDPGNQVDSDLANKFIDESASRLNFQFQ